MKKNTIIYIILGILLLVIFSLILFFINNGKGQININVIPEDASYTVDGMNYQGDNVLELKTRQYNITFNRYMFYEKEINIGVKRNRIIEINVALEIDKKFSDNYYNLSKEEQQIIEGFSQEIQAQEEKVLEETTPITKSLPYSGNGFSIGYYFVDVSDPNKIGYEIIYNNVETLTTVKKDAFSWLEKMGVNTNTAVIDFILKN